MASKDRRSNKPPEVRKVFVCGWCGAKLKSQQDRNKHLMKKHW